MLNFGVIVEETSLDGIVQDELDFAQWFTFEEAKEQLLKGCQEGGLAGEFFLYHLDNLSKNWG